MENTGFEKYNGRVNISADVKPWLNLGAQVSGYVSNMEPSAKYTASDKKDTSVDVCSPTHQQRLPVWYSVHRTDDTEL